MGAGLHHGLIQRTPVPGRNGAPFEDRHPDNERGPMHSEDGTLVPIVNREFALRLSRRALRRAARHRRLPGRIDQEFGLGFGLRVSLLMGTRVAELKSRGAVVRP